MKSETEIKKEKYKMYLKSETENSKWISNSKRKAQSVSEKQNGKYKVHLKFKIEHVQES